MEEKNISAAKYWLTTNADSFNTRAPQVIKKHIAEYLEALRNKPTKEYWLITTVDRFNNQSTKVIKKHPVDYLAKKLKKGSSSEALLLALPISLAQYRKFNKAYKGD